MEFAEWYAAISSAGPAEAEALLERGREAFGGALPLVDLVRRPRLDLLSRVFAKPEPRRVVYWARPAEGGPVYIGATGGKLRERMLQHLRAMTPFGRFIDWRDVPRGIEFITVPKDVGLLAVEGRLISLLKPGLNKVTPGVAR